MPQNNLVEKEVDTSKPKSNLKPTTRRPVANTKKLKLMAIH
jgi:hypothetical protein